MKINKPEYSLERTFYNSFNVLHNGPVLTRKIGKVFLFLSGSHSWCAQPSFLHLQRNKPAYFKTRNEAMEFLISEFERKLSPDECNSWNGL